MASRFTIAALAVIGALMGFAIADGLRIERICSATANAPLCELAKEAGEPDARAIAQGNGDYR
jgi:hypothetical protein